MIFRNLICRLKCNIYGRISKEQAIAIANTEMESESWDRNYSPHIERDIMAYEVVYKMMTPYAMYMKIKVHAHTGMIVYKSTYVVR